MNKNNYTIVGAGFAGATCARLLAEQGHKCLVIEKESHPGGHCHTENINGILVHKYGPHVFHTNNEEVWAFVNRFAEFNQYKLKVLSNVKGEIYSFPVNYLTLSYLFNITDPVKIEEQIYKERLPYIKAIEVEKREPYSLEEYALSIMGPTIYNTFFKGYTTKQWGTDPKNLPWQILTRIPFRLNADDSYFAKHRNKYEGVPIEGYTKLIENILDHPNIEVKCNANYIDNQNWYDMFEAKTIFTGPIDSYFKFCYGKLPYRSLKFEHLILPDKMFQGSAVVNYPDINIPWTRITEHKHFAADNTLLDKSGTVISKEFPVSYDGSNEPYYPINNEENNKLYEQYKSLADKENGVYFVGRLAEYVYMDMDQTIEKAMELVKNLI